MSSFPPASASRDEETEFSCETEMNSSGRGIHSCPAVTEGRRTYDVLRRATRRRRFLVILVRRLERRGGGDGSGKASGQIRSESAASQQRGKSLHMKMFHQNANVFF